MSKTISELVGGMDDLFRIFGDTLNNKLRVAIPCLVHSFDPNTQTITAQPVLRENIRKPDLTTEWVQLPLLLDVPIVLPRAGNFVMTMPVAVGDECLVIFADMCIDAWYSNGGIQNQIEKRRHDLSDAIAILGIWSQPNKISDYSTDSTQLRTFDGTSYIELKDNEINLVASSVKANGRSVLTS